MCFNGFQGQPHLAIVHKIILVKIDPALTESGVFPPFMSLHDDEIIDRFDLFRGIITEDGFQNELVIVLIIEPAQERFLLHELFHGLIIIVNDGIFSGSLVLEDKEPIESENLTVKDIAVIHYISSPSSFISKRFDKNRRDRISCTPSMI